MAISIVFDSKDITDSLGTIINTLKDYLLKRVLI